MDGAARRETGAGRMSLSVSLSHALPGLGQNTCNGLLKFQHMV